MIRKPTVAILCNFQPLATQYDRLDNGPKTEILESGSRTKIK